MKKRILSLILAVSLILSTIPVNAFKVSVLYGDVNTDQAINMKDVLALQKYIAMEDILIDEIAADVFADSKLDNNDLHLLKQYIAGWDVFLGPAIHTVTFHTNGGASISTVEIRQGNTLDETPNAEKENAIFLGWYTDSELTNKFYAETPVVSSLDLYAKYADTKNQEMFADNTFTLSEQLPELSFEIKSSDEQISKDTILNDIILENIGNSEYINLEVTGDNGDFTVKAKGGFTKGASYKLTLNNDLLEFKEKGSSYRICTFTIAKAEVIDIELNDELIYIKSSQISDIIASGLIVDSLAVAIFGNTNTKVEGSFSYEDASKLKIGDVLCVYENIKPSDRNTNADYSDDNVAYVEVTGINLSTVSFKGTDAEKVLALPDTLPIAQSLMTEYNADGSFSISESSLDFAKYTELGLDSNTKVDAGDFVVITETDNDIVYGKISNVTDVNGSVTVSFIITSENEILSTSLDYYTKTSVDGDVMLENADVPKLERQIEAQTKQSGFAKSALSYLAFASTQTDGFKKISGVSDFIMTTPDGKPVNPANIDLKQLGIGYEGENITVEADIDTNTEHFQKGLRIAVRVSGEITIGAGEENEVVILLSASFVEEVKMSFNADGGAVWKLWKGFLPYISDYKMNANIDVYNFTGISVSANITLQEKDDGSIDISEELENLMNNEDEDEISAGVQDLFEAYGDMLNNDTDYVTLFDKSLIENKAWVDPFCIIAYAFKVDFVVNANLNIALGCNLEYMSGTRYNFWFAIKAKSAGNSSMDLIDETFGFQFYVMGHLGIRAGLQFEFAVGLFSTDLASLGLVSEAGAYLELFGYFFYDYESVRAIGESQAERSSKMCGALYLEFGIYLEISFKAQAGNEKYVYNPTLYENQWPLLWAGARINVYDFGYDQPAEDDTVVMKDVTSEALPDSIRYMDCLDMKEGDLSINEYELSNFYYTLSNSNFALDTATGIVKVTVPEDVRYMECDLNITWNVQKLAFSNRDLTRTIHLIWTNLTDTELKEKYDVSVRVGKNIVWSTRVNRGETPVLPTQDEILELIDYNKYIVDNTNLKYTGFTGYGNQVAAPATSKQIYTFDVTEREYTLTIGGVQDKNGATTSKSIIANFGENFDLSSLSSTGTSIAGKTYTRFFNIESNYEIARQAIDRIDTTFATQLLLNSYTYTAKYVDNSCKVTYLFNTIYGQSFAKVNELVEKDKIPSFNYSDYLMSQDVGYIVKDWDYNIGKVTSDTTFTATCTEPTGEKYTINFVTNGANELEAIMRYEGAAITAPVEPIRIGFTFNGWFKDQELTQEYTFAKMTKGSFTLYAKWTANEYTVNFDANGGECDTTNINVTYDNTYGNLPKATQPGFAFVGWFTSSNGGTKVVSTDKIDFTQNITLFAQWTEKTLITGIDTAVQTTIYNKNVQAFEIKGTTLDGFIVKYKKAGDSDWTLTATNAGAYAIMISRPEDDNYKAYDKALTDAFIINKASRSITPPAEVSTLFRTVSVSPVRNIEGYGDGAVEYAATPSTTPPSSGWTTSQSIVNLNPSSSYYVFARVTEGDNYLAATSVASNSIFTSAAENPVSSTLLPPPWDSLGYFVFYNGSVKTSNVGSAGTDSGNILMKFLYRDGTSGSGQALSSSSDMEKNSSHAFTVADKKDPWAIRGVSIVNLDKGAGSGWHGEYVDISTYSGAPATRISLNRWFEDKDVYVDYASDAFKRLITGIGNFDTWNGSYSVDSSSAETLEFTYDGKVTDQYGTYNVFAHDDAPQLFINPSKASYYDCFSYSINKFSVDKAALYQKMLKRGDDQIVFTINFKFDARSTINNDFTRTITIQRQ